MPDSDQHGPVVEHDVDLLSEPALHDQDMSGSSAWPEKAAAVDEHEHTATQLLVELGSSDANLEELEITHRLRSPSDDTHHLTSPDAQMREREEDLGSTYTDPPLPKEEPIPPDNGDDILVKIDVPEGHSPLTAKPLILTSTILIIVLIFNLGCVISMITILLRSDQSHRLYTSNPSVQTIIRYMPSLVGTITTVTARTMSFALSRLELYIAMADPSSDADANSGQRQGQGTVVHCYSEIIELPTWKNLFCRSYKWRPSDLQYWLWVITGVNALLISYVPAFKSTFLLGGPNPSPTDLNAWIVTVSPISTFILIFLYAWNVAFIILVLTHLRSRCTGLKWEPVTIADHLALFHESNVLRDFEALEKEPDAESRKLLRDKEYRLGYWEKGRDRRVVYGIGRETKSPIPSRNANVEKVKDDNILAEQAITFDTNQPDPGNRTCTSRSHLAFCTCPQEYDSTEDSHSKNSFYPPWAVWCWWLTILVCISVCIAALLQGVLKKGFRLSNWGPHGLANFNSSPTNPATNATFDNSPFGNATFIGVFEDDLVPFLYAFAFRACLVLPASFFALYFLHRLDVGHRFSQPFANMARSDTSATDSILLNYIFGAPGIVTINAINNRHWRVAWFSFLSLASSSFPSFVAGLFTMTNTGPWIIFDIHKASFYLVLVYLILYASTLPFAWPSRDRRLRRSFTSTADWVSLCYASHVLKDPALDISGANVTQRHLEARLFLQEEKYRVGLYTGSDGKRHFGFDTAFLKDGSGNTVEHVRPLLEWPEDKTKLLNHRV